MHSSFSTKNLGRSLIGTVLTISLIVAACHGGGRKSIIGKSGIVTIQFTAMGTGPFAHCPPRPFEFAGAMWGTGFPAPMSMQPGTLRGRFTVTSDRSGTFVSDTNHVKVTFYKDFTNHPLSVC